MLKLYIRGITEVVTLNSKVTSKLRAKLPQKNEKNNPASLKINHTKQYWMVLCKVVTSLIPCKVSVIISINKNINVIKSISIIKKILIVSTKNVHKDSPTNKNSTNTKYMKNIGE